MAAPLRILYVEDNELLREVTAELLGEEHRHVVALPTAEEALAAFGASSFDLLITDVSLPQMSGIELARSILRIKPDFPIIIASGYSLEFGLENWGANVQAIIKPFSGPDIDVLIDKLFKRQGLDRRIPT